MAIIINHIILIAKIIDIFIFVMLLLVCDKNITNVIENIAKSFEREKSHMHPLITRDPVSGGEMIVTRLECPDSGIIIEGQFGLGWIGRLTREQLDFVELLVKYRGNVQKLAVEMNVAYNTARSRLDEIVTALGGAPENDGRLDRRVVLDRLAAKEISVEEAMRLLKS